MIHVIIPFEVRAESLKEVEEVIQTFILAIRKNESGTLMYKSFQEKDNPAKFVHVMTFKDEKAQAFHRETPHCKEFVSKLYPLCSVEPQPKSYNEVG